MRYHMVATGATGEGLDPRVWSRHLTLRLPPPPHTAGFNVDPEPPRNLAADGDLLHPLR